MGMTVHGGSVLAHEDSGSKEASKGLASWDSRIKGLLSCSSSSQQQKGQSFEEMSTTSPIFENVTSSSSSVSTEPPDKGIPLAGLESWDDATWILTSYFIIFTMQSGFGLLEAGIVHPKNETNIMIKNLVDVVFGGLSYWVFGYGLSSGQSDGNNPFCGVGHWFVTSKDDDQMGLVYSNFIFQLSFTTTATTIVSGAMAERTKLDAYIIFSFFNTLVYCLPAHWMWAENGILRHYGVIDVAGSGVVHLLGGVSALVAAIILGPRSGRFDKDSKTGNMGHPTNAVMGLFMLWWGWLAFNAGSTYGISGGKWKLASRSATVTMIASIGGGMQGIFMSYILTRKFLIDDIINSILGSLVSITGSCAVVHPYEGIIIGFIGGFLCMMMPRVMEKLKVDDPVGAFPVHGIGGLWGILAVGLFVDIDKAEDMTMGQRGLFHGGGPALLGRQAVAALVIIVWTVITTLFILLPLHFTMGLRLSPEDELLGSDFCEHGIDHYSKAVSVEDGMKSNESTKRDSLRLRNNLQGKTSRAGNAASEPVIVVDQHKDGIDNH